MYAKVPEEVKGLLIKNLKQNRLKSSLRNFPALLIIFSSIVGLAVFVKGHAWIELLQRVLAIQISDLMFFGIMAGIVAIFTASVLVFFLRQNYAECMCDDYLYCRKCNAVDNYEEGHCPLCNSTLMERAAFIYVSDTEEKEIVKKWGLEICQEAKDLNSA